MLRPNLARSLENPDPGAPESQLLKQKMRPQLDTGVGPLTAGNNEAQRRELTHARRPPRREPALAFGKTRILHTAFPRPCSSSKAARKEISSEARGAHGRSVFCSAPSCSKTPRPDSRWSTQA